MEKEIFSENLNVKLLTLENDESIWVHCVDFSRYCFAVGSNRFDTNEIFSFSSILYFAADFFFCVIYLKLWPLIEFVDSNLIRRWKCEMNLNIWNIFPCPGIFSHLQRYHILNKRNKAKILFAKFHILLVAFSFICRLKSESNGSFVCSSISSIYSSNHTIV